ncbi:hypothetical protein B0J13DRAFT_523008 [Dactylonectria estremocensis]|uniref:Uncharacterized protein n=1 Tax=Dactylonectria estremocensis TaxID=1079267 RepID=A0A9P9F2B4_9HYPO|nr:hypothetical protein B0J13DRAFT_523008 [Dactylonectria estremocensis]
MTDCKDKYSGIMWSYCGVDDMHCDLGNNRKVHRLHIGNYGGAVANFVVYSYGDLTSKSIAMAAASESAADSASATAGSVNVAGRLTQPSTRAGVILFEIAIVELFL